MSALRGKVALVTGATNPLGRAAALALASEGSAVVICDSLPDPTTQYSPENTAIAIRDQILSSGGRAVSHAGDRTTGMGAQGMIDAALREFGRLDVLVNAPSTTAMREPGAITDDVFDMVVRSHLKAQTTISCRAVEHWRTQLTGEGFAGGTIINTTREAGGIASLTAALATATASQGIRVNGIAPLSKVRIRWLLPDQGSGQGATKEIHDFEPIDPVMMSYVIAWLASDAADFTGRIIWATADEIGFWEPWQIAASVPHHHPQQPADMVAVGSQLLDAP